MKEQVHLQVILNKKLMEYRQRNPAFSMRAFAKKLGLQPSATNEILQGKRRVSRKLALKIAQGLLLDPTERMNLLKDFPEVLKRKNDYRDPRAEALSHLKLSANQFELISEWSHYAILSLVNTKGFVSDAEWMARRLELSVPKVKECLKRLQELKLLAVDDKGQITRTQESTDTSDDILNLSIQKSHLNDMEMAKGKLKEGDVLFRDFTSYTLPFDLELMPKAKELIRKFQDDLHELMKDRNPTEVYKLNTYLYPLTHIDQQQGERP